MELVHIDGRRSTGPMPAGSDTDHNAVLAGLAADYLLLSLQTPIGGIPCVTVNDIDGARRLIRTAFLATFNSATKG